MKKIPKSIRRVIIDKKNGDLTLSSNKRVESVLDYTKKYFGGLPDRPYAVTYSVSRRGKYAVTRDGIFPDPCIRLAEDESDKGIYICFLHGSWIGLRVSRRVEKVKK